MARFSTLHSAHDNATARFLAARDAYYAAIDLCAAHYSDAAWESQGLAEQVFRAARSTVEAAGADLSRATAEFANA